MNEPNLVTELKRILALAESTKPEQTAKDLQPETTTAEPAWVTSTPELPETTDPSAEHGYFLHMFNTSVGIEHIEVTREHYITLKACLAALLGFGPRENKFPHRIPTPDARKMLIEADDDEAQVLAAALESMRYSSGCDTPVESFLKQILEDNSMRPVDEESIDGLYKELKMDLDDLQRNLTEYPTRHPWLLKRPAA